MASEWKDMAFKNKESLPLDQLLTINNLGILFAFQPELFDTFRSSFR